MVELSDWNRRLWQTRWNGAAVLLVFLLGLLVFSSRTGSRIGWHSPPQAGDEPDFELIALELAAGRGFQVDFDNPEWRDTNPGLRDRHGSGATTYRPPLFPAMVAGLYRLFGRDWAAVRVVNCVLMAAAGAIAAALVAGRLGPLPAVLCGGLFTVIDHRPRYFPGQFMTESLAAFLTVLTAALMIRYANNGRRGMLVAAGVCFGLAVLNRTVGVLWLPILLLSVAAVDPRRTAVSAAGATIAGQVADPADRPSLRQELRMLGQTWRPRLIAALIFGAAATVVLLPWGIRNSLLLGRFMPMGSHGQVQLASGFSDKAVELRGVWHNMNEEHFFDAVNELPPGRGWELAAADLSQQAAKEWIRTHPGQTVKLTLIKPFEEWRPKMFFEQTLLGLALLGLLTWPVRNERRILIGTLLAMTFAVAMTWSVGGRFLVPILPLFHMATALGAWLLLLLITNGRFLRTHWLSRTPPVRQPDLNQSLRRAKPSASDR